MITYENTIVGTCRVWGRACSNIQGHSLQWRDVIISAMASQITSLTIVYSAVYSGADRAGNSPVTGEFPLEMASNAENASFWWRRHAFYVIFCTAYMIGSVFPRPRAGYRRLFRNRRKSFWSKGLVGLSLRMWLSTKHASDGSSINNSNFLDNYIWL